MFYFFCPRCDRAFSGDTKEKAEEVVKAHVNRSHPDYDPEWFDTSIDAS